MFIGTLGDFQETKYPIHPTACGTSPWQGEDGRGLAFNLGIVISRNRLTTFLT